MQQPPLGRGLVPSAPGSMRSGLEPAPSMRSVTTAPDAPVDAIQRDDMNNTTTSVGSSVSKGGGGGSAGGSASLQARKLQMMVEQELAMSTSALHEQFRQQLEIERSDRQTALADMRQDIKALKETLLALEKNPPGQGQSAGNSGAVDVALLDVRGQVASLRDDVRSSMARQDSMVGDFEAVRRDIEGMRSLRDQARDQSGLIEQQQLSTASLREDLLALAQRLLIVEQGTAEAASAAAAAAMTRLDTSQFLTAVRLEIGEPLESQLKREIESVQKQALDRIDDVKADFDMAVKSQRSDMEQLRASVKDEQGNQSSASGIDKVRLEDIQSALEAEHEARKAAVDELRANITEAWGAAARSAQTTNETSGRVRELTENLATEKKLREATLEDIQRRLPSAGTVSVQSAGAGNEISSKVAATNARLDEIARSLENEKQVRTAEVEDLLSRIMHLSAKSVAAAALPAAPASSPEALTALAGNADAAANKVDSIRLRNEVLEELRMEFSGRVKAMITEMSADLRAELVARIEAIESHLWRLKTNEDLREKMEEVLRLTRMVIGQTEQLQAQVVKESGMRKTGDTNLSTRIERLERSMIEKGVKGIVQTPTQQADFAPSVSSVGHMSNATPTTGTVLSEEETLEDPMAPDQASGFISSALRNTLEELVDKVQKTLRPGSVERGGMQDNASEATPSEASHPQNEGAKPFDISGMARQQMARLSTPSVERGQNRSLSRGLEPVGVKKFTRNRSPVTRISQSPTSPLSVQETALPSPRPAEGTPTSDAIGGIQRVASCELRSGALQDSQRNVVPETIVEGAGEGPDSDSGRLANSLRAVNAAYANLASEFTSGNLRNDGSLPRTQGGSVTMSGPTLGMKPQRMSPSPRMPSATRQGSLQGRTQSIEATAQRSTSMNRGAQGATTIYAAGNPPGASTQTPTSKTAVRGPSFPATQGTRMASSPPPFGTTVSTTAPISSPTSGTRTKLYQGVINSTPQPQPQPQRR